MKRTTRNAAPAASTDTAPASQSPAVITRAELKGEGGNIHLAIPAGAGLTADAFNSLGGELFAGLNILKLEIGAADGPFVVTDISEKEIEGKARKGKKAEKSVVTQYTSTRLGDERPVMLPIAASFIQRAEDAKVKVGDIIAIRRGENYKDKVFNQTCQSYELRVCARAGGAAEEFTKKYLTPAGES